SHKRSGELRLADNGSVRRNPVLRLVDAAGFLRKGIAGDGVSTGAGAAADFLVLAGAAVAPQAAGIPERFEDRSVLVNVGEGFLPDVAGVDGQESARIHIPHVRDKQEALSVIDTAGHPILCTRLSVGLRCTGFVRARDGARMSMAVPYLLLLQVVLEEVAAVVHGFGSLDLETDAVGELVDLSKHLFEFFAGEEIAKLAASHGNEEEDVPHNNVQFFEERAEVVEVLCVVAADGSVDLDGKTCFAGPFDRLNGALPGAWEPAEGVVDLWA